MLTTSLLRLTAVALAGATALGCHVHGSSIDFIEIDRSLVPRTKSAKPQPRTILLEHDGRLRFVEPLVCASDIVITRQEYITRTVQPNLAMVVVGVVVGSLSGIALVSGLSSDDGSLLTTVGAAGLVTGVPLVIGPFTSLTKRRRPGGTDRVPMGVRHNQPCGERPVQATTAMVEVRGRLVFGRLDSQGYFSVPLFEFVDLFAIPGLKSVELRATLIGNIITRTVSASLSGETVAAAAPGYLISADLDGTIHKPLLKVPTLRHSDLIAVTTTDGDQEVVLVTCQVSNEGPGQAEGVRVILVSDHPELDNRVIYFGRLRVGETRGASVSIPVRTTASLTKTQLLARMRDGHQTAPQYTIRTTVQRQLKAAPPAP